MKAARRVNRPSAISTPATSSIIAAASSIVGSGSGAPTCATGKWNSFAVPCSRNSNAVTIRNRASNWGCQRDSQGSSIPSSQSALRAVYRNSRRARQVSGMFLGLRLLRAVRRILGEQLARAVDHFDPIVEIMRQARDQLLERSVFEAAVAVEGIVADVAEIGLRLLHHGHVEEHRRL